MLFQAALGRLTGDPIPPDIVSGCRKRLEGTLQQFGLDAAPRHGDMDQPIRVRLLAALARAVGDPDPDIADQVAVGVETGILTD